MRLAAPSVLIDINGLSGLAGVAVDGGTLRIGALTRHRELERSREVAAHAPLISQAMPHVAHAAIRNRGTFGGSIAYADPAAELPACSVALDGEFVLASRSGERRVAARPFLRGLYETDLRSGELLIAGEFPVQKAHERSAFLELARRRGDYAIVGVAARADFREGELWNARFVLFGVGATPVSATHVAAVLEGARFSRPLVAAAQAAVTNDIAPGDDVYQSAATKLHLARVLVGRASAALFGMQEAKAVS